MVNESFYLEIMNLIASKTEGQYWDFKREPHKNNESLVHDILCLANTKHDGDRFLIIGVADPSKNCEIIGLDENTEFDNLETRIKQVEYLAKRLDEFGIPYQRPAGGHALFIDAPKVLTHVPKEEFPAQTLTVELYLEAGIRGCEIGYILADRDPVTRENRFGGLDLLRLAIPRRVYTNNHMDVIAVALKNVYDRREQITRGFQITWEAPLMRHFTVQLERAK